MRIDSRSSNGMRFDHRNRGAAVEARKMQHRPVIESQATSSVRREHGLGKERGIFVVADDVGAAGKARQAQTFPMIRVVRKGDRDARSVGTERGVRHDVRFERRHVRNARIFAAVSRMRDAVRTAPSVPARTSAARPRNRSAVGCMRTVPMREMFPLATQRG